MAPTPPAPSGSSENQDRDYVIFARIIPGGIEFSSREFMTEICSVSLTACVNNLVSGNVDATVLQKADLSAADRLKVSKVIALNNQIVRLGGTLDYTTNHKDETFRELRLDDNAYLQEGGLQFNKEAQIGNLVGNIPVQNVVVKGVKFEKESGITKLSFLDTNSQITINRLSFSGVKPYSDKNEAYIKLNEKGEIIESDLTFDSEKTLYDISGFSNIRLPEGARLSILPNGQLKIISTDIINDDITSQRNIIFSVDGNNILVPSDVIIKKVPRGISVQGAFAVGSLDSLNHLPNSAMPIYQAEEGVSSSQSNVIINNNHLVYLPKNTEASIQGIDLLIKSNNGLNYYYGSFNPLEHQDENYFFRSSNKISMNGDGFSFGFANNEKALVQQGIFANLQSSFLIEPKGGTISIERTSRMSESFRGNFITQGDYSIDNGRWKFNSKEGRLNVDFQELPNSLVGSEFTKNVNSVASGMSLSFKNPQGRTSSYQLTKTYNYDEGYYSEIVSGSGVSISSQGLIGDRNILFNFQKPSFEYNGQSYSTSSYNAVLNSNFYENLFKKSKDYNLDPYFVTATTIIEYSGIRAFNEQDTNYIATNGGYLRINDPLSILGGTPGGRARINQYLRERGIDVQINSMDDLSKLDNEYKVPIQELNSLRNIASFTAGTLYQDTAIQNYRNGIGRGLSQEEAIAYGLQNYQGYGYMDTKGAQYHYPHIKGSDFPLFGYNLRALMLNLYNNPEVRSMVEQSGARTPLMDIIKGN